MLDFYRLYQNNTVTKFSAERQKERSLWTVKSFNILVSTSEREGKGFYINYAAIIESQNHKMV